MVFFFVFSSDFGRWISIGKQLKLQSVVATFRLKILSHSVNTNEDGVSLLNLR